MENYPKQILLKHVLVKRILVKHTLLKYYSKKTSIVKGFTEKLFDSPSFSNEYAMNLFFCMYTDKKARKTPVLRHCNPKLTKKSSKAT